MCQTNLLVGFEIVFSYSIIIIMMMNILVIIVIRVI